MQQQKLYREENNKTVSRANKLSTMAEILGNILFGVMLILVILLVFSLLSSKLYPQMAFRVNKVSLLYMPLLFTRIMN